MFINTIAPLELDSLAHFVIECLVAVLCGVIIGLERESKGKPAGLRTLVLISLGSSIFVHISKLLAEDYGDPGRVAAQIVTGIGFLGAGAIVQKSERGYIAGLTTAASIWVTAALGMMVGGGYWTLAIIGMLIAVLCLRVFRYLETVLFYGSATEIRKVRFRSNYGKTRWALMGLLEDNLLRPDEYHFIEESEGVGILELKYIHKNRNHRSFLAQAAPAPEILEIS